MYDYKNIKIGDTRITISDMCIHIVDSYKYLKEILN